MNRRWATAVKRCGLRPIVAIIAVVLITAILAASSFGADPTASRILGHSYDLGQSLEGYDRSANGATPSRGGASSPHWYGDAGQSPRAGARVTGFGFAPQTAGRAGGLADDVARAGPPNRIYSERELIRRAEKPGPYHNFPGSFDDVIFDQGTRSVVPDYYNKARPLLSNDSVQYRLPGSVNGTEGMYEIFARPSVSGRTEVIMHRFFRPFG